MTTTGSSSVDREGMETLEVIAGADRFNRWMFEVVEPFCGPTVLEVGSGIGNISRYFLDSRPGVLLTDLRESYLERLRASFAGRPSLLGVEPIDLVDPEFERRHAGRLGRFDTVVALNVIEHIEDDRSAAENCRRLLKPGGTFVMLVPAYQWLFNGFDRALQHHRRYTVTRAAQLLERSGFTVVHRRYFNAAGIAGWFVSGTLLRKTQIPQGQMRLYNALVPAFRLIDAAVMKRFGLSAIVVGRNPA